MSTGIPRFLFFRRNVLVLVLILLLFLHLALPTSAANRRLDVCASTEEEERLHWRDFHEGVFIDISTGELAGMRPSPQGKNCAIDLRLNETHGERTEVSFFKDAVLDEEKCFDILYEDRDRWEDLYRY